MFSRAIAEYWHILLLAAAMVSWRLWGHHVTTALRQIDQRKRSAELQAMYDRANPNSHFRQSVEQINEDTPPVVASLSDPGTFTWSGTSFHTRAEAEAARWNHVLSEARDFYQDLDRELGNRIGRSKQSDTIDGGSR
jgi:hypothetical protein